MKRLLYILLLLFVGLQIGCRSTDYAEPSDPSNSSCSFNLAVEAYDGQAAKAEDLQPITSLKAAIYDHQGRLVQKYVGITYSTDLKKIDVEGLRDGRYTIAFFAIGEQRHEVTITPPSTLDEPWIPQSATSNLEYNEYLATKIPFEIRGGVCETQLVTLKHVVSKISVNVDFSYPNWAGGEVKSFIIEFPDGTFATNHTLNGAYTGSEKQRFELGEALRNIYLMPASSSNKVKGRAIIIGTYSDKSECRAEQEFSIAIEPNKRSTINITFDQTKADNLGLIRYYDSQRTLYKSREVWQDGGDKSEFMNGKAYYPTKPIALVLDAAKKELTVTFYGGVKLTDVTVMAKRPNDAEFFELAWFETIAPFEERKVSFASNMSPKLYRTESGKLAMCDGLKTLDGVQIKYKSEDTFIKKIQTIKWPRWVTFDAQPWIAPGQAYPSGATKCLGARAMYAREAMAMLTNAGYVLSTQKWYDRMLAIEAEGAFTHNGANISFEKVIYPSVMRAYRLNLSVLNPNHDYTLQGVANIGDGEFISLREFVYVEHYTSWQRLETFYHEYMHTSGYGHEGTMTYGKFCAQTSQFHVSMATELPYNSASILHSWDNPTRYR